MKIKLFDQPKVANRRIELDFLRGLAILLVLGLHFNTPDSGIYFLDKTILIIKSFGGTGVNLFFSLSGFLVGGLLLKELKATGNINAPRFLVRRAIKIWPPLYFLLIVHTFSGHHPINTFLWQNLLHVQNYFGTSINQTWSLAVEEHFYLFLAFFISYQAKKTPKKIIFNLLIVIVISVSLRLIAVNYGYLDATFRQTQYRMDSLLFGVILSVVNIYYKESFDRLASNRLLLNISFVILMLTILLTVNNPYLDRSVGYLVQAIGFTLLIVQVLTSKSIFKNSIIYRFIAWIGIYSYGIYLWHSISVGPSRKIQKILFNQGYNELTILITVVLFQLFLSVFLGYITSIIIEWPSLSLRDRFYPSGKKS
ncbi:MAG TPA: acyltransferase, partial [Flavobacterium sp.]|nr:acyltransferase [Flavobacterium sp.]